MRSSIVFLALVLVALAITPGAAKEIIRVTLSGPALLPGCSGDADSDCLDDASEAELAFVLSPQYYYDEGEDCAAASYISTSNGLHFGRRDFFQVRPVGPDVAAWRPDEAAKWVHVTYFFTYPHDCQNHFGLFGGHMGDSEHVRFRLFSYDLVTWYLDGGWYWHHDRVDFFDAAYLSGRAAEVGSVYPAVAADSDSHGSWPGRMGGSDHCADSEDTFCFGECDCFRGSFAEAHRQGWWDFIAADQNVGGPPPERWRADQVTVEGNEAFSVLDVGHGANREYWTPHQGRFQLFCGWECADRNDEGHCNHEAHGKDWCVTPLSKKVDTTAFTVGSSAPAAAPPVSWEDRPPLPLLAGMPQERHLQTLSWLLRVPAGKIVAAFPDLLAAHGTPLARREATARSRTLTMIQSLTGTTRPISPSASLPTSVRVDASVAPAPAAPSYQGFDQVDPSPGP